MVEEEFDPLFVGARGIALFEAMLNNVRENLFAAQLDGECG
jgi:hypothetical protein